MKVIHLNDSKGELGSDEIDTSISDWDTLERTDSEPSSNTMPFKELPFIMETPIDERCDEAGNIKKARELSS